MERLCKLLSGSRLYGCDVPDSDFDYKGVYVANLDELVRGELGVRNSVTPATDEDCKVEEEYFHVQKFAHLLAGQETVVLSCLFTPPEFWIETSPEWKWLYDNRKNFISKDIKALAGYSRSQACKYGIKGEKLRTLMDFSEALQKLADHPREAKYRITNPETGSLIIEVFEALEVTFRDRPGVRLWAHERGEVVIRHIEVCGKSFGHTTPFKLWLPVVNKMVSKYGDRSKEAMEADGSDRKAQYHAVRILSEATQLLTTGDITYPRPERTLLLDIRKGRLSNDEVVDVIDAAFETMNEAERTSTLPQSRRKECEEWGIGVQKERVRAEVAHQVYNRI